MKLKKLLLIIALFQLLTLSSYSKNTDEWLIGPKLGFSFHSGVTGIEVQKNDWGFNFGMNLANTYVFGLKYYFSGLDHSWYCGPFYWHGNGDDFDDLDFIVGFGFGHRWQYKNGFNIGFGASAYYYEENDNPDEDEAMLLPEFYFGYSF